MITRTGLALGPAMAAVGVRAQPPTLSDVPLIEMHEHYRPSGRSQTVLEASASYGPFHLTSQTCP